MQVGMDTIFTTETQIPCEDETPNWNSRITNVGRQNYHIIGPDEPTDAGLGRVEVLDIFITKTYNRYTKYLHGTQLRSQ